MTGALLEGLALLAEAVDLAVTVVNQDEQVLEWNPAAERLYGIKRSAILGKDITGFFSPTSLIVREVIRTGRRVDSRYHQPRAGIYVLITAVPLCIEGRIAGAIAVERDVTRIVELTAELMIARDRVAALERQQTGPRSPTPVGNDPFRLIHGNHPALLEAVTLARRVADTETTILIRGDSGVGKELFARGIHDASPRRDSPFVALNCGAIPTMLFESELFGYAPGAFTGANPKGEVGKLSQADGGTLFLDEVGELPMQSQVKLLRVLEERTFYRVGGSSLISVNVRILAATNQPLETMIQSGRFRDDLYWRLDTVTLEIPPLRDRKQDIPELVQLYLHEFGIRHRRPVGRMDPAVVRALLEYSWPGNVRELRNVVERLVVLAADGAVTMDLLPPTLRSRGVPEVPPASEVAPVQVEGLRETRDRAERAEVVRALEIAGGNRTAAASLLGVSRVSLYGIFKRLGIQL